MPLSYSDATTNDTSAYLARLGCDLHVHVLSGIDDGAPSLDESLAIIEAHYRAGYRRIIATPHIRSDFFPNTRHTIHEAWVTLNEIVCKRWPDLSLTYAAEHFADDYLMLMLEEELLLPLSGRYVLIETSMRDEHPYFVDIVRALIDKGWQPVLAHPERYRPWHAKPKRYAEMREMGLIFQINLLSLGGQYGSVEKSMAERLIRQGWAGAVGTDLHRANQYPYLQKAARTPEFEMLCDLPLLNYTINTHEERNR
ncbi:tyrosine-protein phosphatase [Salmonirosea aquatica]|uniref:protein-tyrosine-phosphatase n=1 Tax=Salmonirosea aquatica TaxID=2654236 RepID=A0A7C9FSC9_9BACT|nr:histidinol phosphatase [Cytophagaceae bacterium SJW1-29]